MPLGISISEFDQAWLNDMNSFGKTRGDFAHNSFGTKLCISPCDALKKVEQLFDGLAVFDEKIMLHG